MNPMLLKIASLPINHKTDSKGKTLISGKGSGGFFSAIQKSMNSVQKKSLYNPNEPAQAGSSQKKEYYFYLESLRKGLLAKGKPLNTISINRKDLSLVKKFLYQCGYSQNDVQKILKELVENNPSREINLSQFLVKVDELGPPEKKIYQPITLDASVIPYIESVLRDFGLKPKELEHALTAARVKGGGLDLNKLVIKLKEISNQIKGRNQVNIDQDMAYQISKKLDQIGIQIPDNGKDARISKKLAQTGIQIPDNRKDARISIKDLITALEKMTGGSDKGNQLPTDVKATIDQIVERVAMNEEKNGLKSHLFSFSRPGLTDLHFKEETGKKGKLFEKENILSTSKEEGAISAKNGQQKAESLFSSKEAKLFSDLDAGQARPLRLSPAERGDGGPGFNRGTTEEGYTITSETRTINIPQNISSLTFSESINTVKQNLEPGRDFLPAYLIDQVGKQISRSILRGERVIRLQLKPPELGTLRVEMDIKDNILKLGMIAENSSVKELLLSNVHELRAALVEQGVKLERFDIQINYDFNQSLANSKEEEGDQELNKLPFMAGDDTEDLISGHRIMIAGDRLLDLVA